MPILNDEQKRAVYIDENTVVIAGAGGGKTSVLASRVLRLLIEKQVPLSKILLLTFTNKACAEMSERVYTLLQTSLQTKSFMGIPLDRCQQDFLHHQQENFQNAQILTLDAFCFRIAQIGMSRMGIITPLSIQENLQIDIEIFAGQWLLSHPESELKKLLYYFTFSSLVHDIISYLLLHCSCFEVDLKNQFEKILENVHLQIIETRKKMLHTITELYETITDTNASSKSACDFLENLKILSNLIVDDTKHIISDNFILSLQGVTNTKEIKPIAMLVKEKKETITQHGHMLLALQNTITYKDYYSTFYIAMQELVDDWNTHRRTFGLYSYENIAEIARYTLQQYKDICKWYANTYEHIIIDEFQDNNLDQKEMLDMLSGQTVLEDKIDDTTRNKYFFVGDPKQSIYSFRGANVRAFLSLQKDNAVLNMLVNYRSNSALIKLFNDWFSKLFEDKNINDECLIEKDTLEKKKIVYNTQIIPQIDEQSPADVILESSSKSSSTLFSYLVSSCERTELSQLNINDSTIQNVSCLFDLIQEDDIKEYNTDSLLENNQKQNEAFLIASRIQSMICDNGVLPEEIAVLARTKSIFSYVASHLIEMNIAYAIEDNKISLRQDLGKDFYAWLGLLLFPEDRSLYAAVLRSPLVGISDNSVMGILAMQHHTTHSTIFTISKNQSELYKYFKTMTRDSIEMQNDMYALEAIKNKYAQALSLLTEGKLVAILDHFWLECGYRVVLLRNKNYHVFLSQYNILKSLIIKYQTKGAIFIIDKIKAIIDGEDKGTETQERTNKKGVQLMSIHKSKGLEFPYVILANAHFNIMHGAIDTKKNTRDDGCFYMDFANPDAPHYLLQSSSYKKLETVFSLKIKNSGKQEKSELLRMLYVALTRAKKAFIISGYLPQPYNPSKECKSSYLNWLQKYALFSRPDIVSSRENRKNACKYSMNAHSVTIIHDEHKIRQKLQNAFSKNVSNQCNKEGFVLNTIENVLNNTRLLERTFQNIEVSPSNGTQIKTIGKAKESIQLPSLSVDVLLNKYNLYTAFGTYCHYLLNHYCKNTKIEVVPVKLESQLLPLTSQEKTKFITEAQILCEGFFQSEMWQLKTQNATVFTEYPFLMWNNTHRIYIRGIIDLLILDTDMYTVVDFKVDKFKKPEHYQYQLAAYRLAVQKQFGISRDIESVYCNLFYLRSKETVPHFFNITEDDLVSYLKNRENTTEELEATTIGILD